MLCTPIGKAGSMCAPPVAVFSTSSGIHAQYDRFPSASLHIRIRCPKTHSLSDSIVGLPHSTLEPYTSLPSRSSAVSACPVRSLFVHFPPYPCDQLEFQHPPLDCYSHVSTLWRVTSSSSLSLHSYSDDLCTIHDIGGTSRDFLSWRILVLKLEQMK